MEIPDLQRYLDQIESLLNPILKQIKSLPPESMPLILGAAACIALLATLLAFLILRSPSTRKKVQAPEQPQDLSSFFKQSGTIMDLAAIDSYDKVIGRAVVTKSNPDYIKMEIIEDLGISSISPSTTIAFLFPPEKIGRGRINCFQGTIISLDCNDDGCGPMTVSPPTALSLVKRRRHKRKKVIDQQFIRVKLWRRKPDTDETAFADAVPDLAVNSYDPRSTGHEDNQVINISNGGIGVSAHHSLVDQKFSLNDDVLINIFMFNFRQKVFKPYWYAGKLRTIEEMDGRSYRLGVEFTMTGKIRDENEQYIDWSKI